MKTFIKATGRQPGEFILSLLDHGNGNLIISFILHNPVVQYKTVVIFKH